MLIRVFGILFLLLLIFGGIAYFNGWISFRGDDDSATIELETGEMEEAADKVLDKGKELIEKAGDKLKDLGDNDDGSTDEIDKREQDTDDLDSKNKGESGGQGPNLNHPL